ncbi:MAG: macro domain-containing protein [Dehalococcoidales bacterium]
MNIKDIKEFFENIKSALYAPILNITLISGLVLVILSFMNLDGIDKISFTASPRWIMFIFGVVLVLGVLTLFIITREEVKINKKIKIKNGLTIKLNSTIVNLKIGKIQDITGMTSTDGIVLPANTTFVDDCITDKRSALGAFMLEHYPDKISEVTKTFLETLEKAGVVPDSEESYPPGTTIILPAPWNNPVNIIVTAATIRKVSVGIVAEPSTICQCIHQLFMITSDKKISRLRIPILGSGHGGLEINAALLYLILSINHYSGYFHHLKTIDIVVIDNDINKLNDIYKLQYLPLLERREK